MKTHLRLLLCLVCFLFTKAGLSQNRVDIGKSFANISRLNTGGTFYPGDTIEIRVTFAVIRLGSTTTIVDSVQVFDVVPANTTYINGSMRVATNQGLTYKGPFTEAADGDAGRKVGNNITMNLGRYANGVRGGRIRADSSRPSFFGSHCIMMACYRVRINPGANFGDTITIGGSVRYKMITPNNGWFTPSFTPIKILLFENNGFCENGTGISAASDHNGTFGDGTTQNRSTGLLFGTTYVRQNISTGQPNDYNYAIVNNSSANGSTNPNSTMPESPANRRVFGYWDIGGDHTGTTDPGRGNAPTAPGQRGGYFVLVNASYNTSVAYSETLSNLCPNTYYEFSAWFRNVCPRCSCDSVGRGSGQSGFIPYPGNDSSGVRPNLSFEIDGVAYYTTGDIKYDRAVPWKKYGFTFRTRPGQTTANFSIRNNSPGGGGNDWAMDDITVAHCGPNITSNYNPFVLGCNANPFEVRLVDTVRSVYNNYVHYKWQVSNVGGTVWTDVPGSYGVGTPTLVNGMYQYVTALPPFMVHPSDSGKYYRVIVATTAASLNSTSCAFNDGSSTLLKVIDCGLVLRTRLLQFRAQKAEGRGWLTWKAADEEDSLVYEIERSDDGINFRKIGDQPAMPALSSSYQFMDDELIGNGIYYRLKLVNNQGLYKYSSVEYLDDAGSFQIFQSPNPFADNLMFEAIAPEDGKMQITVLSGDGKRVHQQWIAVRKGRNNISIPQSWSAGPYVLQAQLNGNTIIKRLVRK